MIHFLAEAATTAAPTAPDTMNIYLDVLFKYGFSVAIATFFVWKINPALDRLTRIVGVAILALRMLDRNVRRQAADILRELPPSKRPALAERSDEESQNADDPE